MDERRIHPQFFGLRVEIRIALHNFPLIDSTSRIFCFPDMHQHEANRYKPSGFGTKNGIEVGRGFVGIVGRVNTNFFDFVHDRRKLLVNKPNQMWTRLCIENNSRVLKVSTS
jgi:hypothetical protein